MGTRIENEPFNIHFLQMCNSLQRRYKGILNTKKKLYRLNIMCKLESLQEKHPRTFWKLFDKLKDLNSKTKSNPISSNEWVTYFSRLVNKSPQINLEHDKLMNGYIAVEK